MSEEISTLAHARQRENELRRKAKGFLLERGWGPGDQIQIHSMIELLVSFGHKMQKETHESHD